MATTSEGIDMSPLTEEGSDRSSISIEDDFGPGGLTPIAEEGTETPKGYFNAYGINNLKADTSGQQKKAVSPFPTYEDPPAEGIDLGSRESSIEVVTAAVSAEGISRPSSPVPNGVPPEGDWSSPVSSQSDREKAHKDNKEDQDHDTGGTVDIKADPPQVDDTVTVSVKDSQSSQSNKLAERAESDSPAVRAKPSLGPIHLELRAPDDSTRRLTPDPGSLRTTSEASEDMEEARTPLIMANIGVMNLDEDIEINLSNTLTLPGLKQGPHFMVGSSRPTSRESKRRDDVRLPRLKKQRFGAFDGRDGRPGYESPLKNRSMLPMARFRRAARLVQLILTAITSTRRENIRREAKLMSFYQLQDELGTTKGRYGEGLDFDPNYFKACRQIQISDQAKQILKMDPKDRVDEQRHTALVSLNQSVEAFGEFPIKMQQSLVRRGWYEHFEAKRVIIRQGHSAENFYFILSGTAVVTILTTNKKTGETSHNTVAFLKKGNSFGELALMYGGTRNATVTCKDDVELLAVGRDDFVDIFMHVDKDVEPDHIQFLRLIDIFDGWPIGTLPYADPKTCLFTYFRRGVLMCRDSIHNEWIYVVKTGSCRVLKALQPVKADMHTIPLDLRGSTNSLGSPSNSPRKSGTPEKPLLSVNRYLPPLKAIDQDAARESRIQHKAKIDKLYEERHNTQTQQRRTLFEKAKAKPVPNAKVYVEIQKLGPKETFGLTSIAFQMIEEPLSLILVSDGAECVLINKKFFLQHLSESHHKYLRTSVQPYPTEDHLQQKLQDQVNWEAYKAVTFQKEVVYKKKLQDTLEL